MRPAATPRRRTPRCWSASTAGLIASARNSDTRIHVNTWRETQTTHNAAAMPIRIAETVTIVRGRTCTRRAGAPMLVWYLRGRIRKLRPYTRPVLRGLIHRGIAGGATRVPGLRRLPMLKLLAIGEIALLARAHIRRLERAERRRLVELLRKGRGRTSGLAPDERDELQRLIAKAEPRLFAGLAADRLSP